jgi:hypothetical protein
MNVRFYCVSTADIPYKMALFDNTYDLMYHYCIELNKLTNFTNLHTLKI